MNIDNFVTALRDEGLDLWWIQGEMVYIMNLGGNKDKMFRVSYKKVLALSGRSIGPFITRAKLHLLF